MKITASNTAKRAYVKQYWKRGRNVLALSRQPITEKAEHVDPDRLKDYVKELMLKKPMNEYINNLWGDVGGRFAYDTESKINRYKSNKLNIEIKADPKKKLYWNEKLKKYSAERSIAKTTSILSTEVEAINKVIDSVIKDSLEQGLGIVESRRMMVDRLGSDLVEMENWQAQRIAMTEVGSAQNTGSFQAAQENSEGVQKEWMFIPGKKTFREKHQAFGEMGPQDMNYEYATGLQYPGDPNGSAEDVINCYCSLTYITEI